MSHDSCKCTGESSTPSVHQTLDELDFSRGIWTAALAGCRLEVLDYIDRTNWDPDALDSSGYTALHYSARNGHTEICKILLENGANPNIQTKSGRVTPLHRAAYCGHTDIVDLLLRFSADSLLADADGKLPIHKAAETGQAKISAILKQAAPSSFLVKDNRGRIPLECSEKPSTELRNILESPT